METIKSPPVSRRTAQARRERIIAAARSLFAQQGFHGTGMAQIARVSEVLVGQIYRDFAGKEDLIAAIVEQDVSGLLDNPELPGVDDPEGARKLNEWVRQFICHKLDDETRRVLADILSEGTRNPRVAAIMMAAHERLRDRLISATIIWAPEPEKATARETLADSILTAAGALQHRQIFGLEAGGAIDAQVVSLIEAEIAKLRSAG